MTDWEMWLIDACALEIAGGYVEAFYERGELGHYTAIIGVLNGGNDDDLYEFDFVTEFMEGWDESDVIKEFGMRLREMTGQYEE